jgi:divalent metal cation (Fe/Co/Zn/Cd) transporter
VNICHSGKAELYKRALWLSYFTVGYNLMEGLISMFAGLLAGSIALTGFGLDSFVESLSGGVMIWRFRKQGHLPEHQEEKIEKRATKLVAYTFFILAVYVLFESARKLYLHEIPQPSLIGIVIAFVSMVIMPFLFYAKYKTGKLIRSKSLVADSKETLACLFLSVVLLIGLGLNYLFGLWQADPIVGFLVVAFLAYEGYETLKEEEE